MKKSIAWPSMCWLKRATPECAERRRNMALVAGDFVVRLKRLGEGFEALGGGGEGTGADEMPLWGHLGDLDLLFVDVQAEDTGGHMISFAKRRGRSGM